MGRKDHCSVTAGQIKARNFTECLFFSFHNKAKYHNRRGLENDPQSFENEVVFCFIFLFFVCLFFSILLQCTSCALNYYSISLLSEQKNMCAWDNCKRLGSNCTFGMHKYTKINCSSNKAKWNWYTLKHNILALRVACMHACTHTCTRAHTHTTHIACMCVN